MENVASTSATSCSLPKERNPGFSHTSGVFDVSKMTLTSLRNGKLFSFGGKSVVITKVAKEILSPCLLDVY